MTRSNDDTVLVTGGHGFLGSHVVDLLLDRGFAVRCLLRPGRDPGLFRGRPVEIVRGDLRRDSGLEAAARGVDCVVHAAGLLAARSPAEFLAVNAAGTRRLARAVVRANPTCRRFLYVSSLAAAGPSPDGRPLTEEDPPRPLTHYGQSKLAGERILRGLRGGLPWSVVRPPAIYGPRDQATLPLFRLAALGLTVGLEGRGRRFHLLHARDVAAGVVAAVLSERAAGRVYFLADRMGCGYAEIARSLARAYGRRLRRIPLPDVAVDAAAVCSDELAGLLGRVPLFGRQKALELKARWWLCSAARAERDLGWAPRVPLDQGIAETARWYAAAGRARAPRGVLSPL